MTVKRQNPAPQAILASQVKTALPKQKLDC
jgi:hypothetical protein